MYRYLITAVLLFCVSSLVAQKEKYYVEEELSNSTPLQTEQVTVSYKLKYKGNSLSLVNPRFNLSNPDFGEHFKVLRKGQNRSMNFDMSGSITVFEYQFVLQPLKTGSFTVDPVTIVYNDDKFVSKPVKIKVLAADAPAQVSQADKIFIDAKVSKAKPWKGEEFYLTYKLYSKYELYNISELIPPTVDGFFRQAFRYR